ncbi:Membrane carboxypeptidase (penicillin-binding protein) [Paramicrobacterium humi]|uniref:Membrane carboxypeptidase (Penicillin-binding protein) n=1 Tax=Paramicrobacterium humi TaxID=640635 RepID=A0A1H4NID7_9MICO|nr:transglycosylase domain-containing protein [Microbacterium humi]SEB94981.1 Membrane carboxypeptidase (penicillin-binding protein) [Microbacterium humi]
MPEQKRTARGVLGGLLGFVGLSAAAGVLATAAVTPALAMAGMSANSAIGVFDSLPEYLEISPLMEKSNIYAKDGDKNVLLASFYEQNREEVQWDQISQYLKDAAVATEDNRFYDHGGIDLTGTLRAVVSNTVGDDVQGGSSITQQYVKNVLVQECERLSEDEEALRKCYEEAAGVDYARKLKEMRYAVGLEKKYSKDEILRGYLNISGFGGVIYGVQSAANYYFGTSAKDVTLAQAATLIGMVNNPNLLRLDKPDNPDNGKDNGYALTKKRRDVVLQAMLHYGKITQKQYDEAIETKIEPKITQPKGGCASAGSNAYFCDYVTKLIRNDPAFGATASDRVATLKRGGLDIYTSLDLRLQKTEGDALHAAVPSHIDGVNLGGTAVTIEPGTGRVLAMVQNTAYSNAKKPGYTSVNYNTDQDYGGSSGFQPGSTWKTMVLVDWLLEGHSINETVNGTRRSFSYDTCNGPVTWPGGPKNAGDGGGGPGGVFTVQHGMTQSINTVLAAMGEKLDLCDIAQVAKDLGAHRADGEPLSTAYPTALIGTSEDTIAPLSMANAYATLAAGGKHCEPRAIDKIVQSDGSEMQVPGQDCNQAIPENVAATAVQTLTKVMTQGTGRGGMVWGQPIFGKTGTTDNYKDTWLVTATTKAANAVWVGNTLTKNFTPMNRTWINGSLGSQIKFGLTRTILSKTIELYGADQFPQADSNLTRRILKEVPSVAGMSVEQATSTLKGAGFGVSVSDEQVPSTVQAGLVDHSDPAGGARVSAGSSVTLYVSNGKGQAVPNVVGQTYHDAEQALKSAGFGNVKRAGECTEPGNPAKDAGKVATQDPAADATANPDTAITLTMYCDDKGNGR